MYSLFEKVRSDLLLENKFNNFVNLAKFGVVSIQCHYSFNTQNLSFFRKKYILELQP